MAIMLNGKKQNDATLRNLCDKELARMVLYSGNELEQELARRLLVSHDQGNNNNCQVGRRKETRCLHVG
jgi:hypothetical protein